MKKYLVIGNPINHSLSPEIHNYWIKKNRINAVYEKKKLNNNELENFIKKVREGKINGINVTVPFKKQIISYLDQLSPEAKKTESVNTIYLKENSIIGHNTDIDGFSLSVKKLNYDLSNKKVFLLGAGGVVPSIIYALKRMKVSNIVISNRTKSKAEDLRRLFENLEVIDWGSIPDFDIIVNATSIGLSESDLFSLNLNNVGKNKLFYDVIYNPSKTDFLKTGEKLGNNTENGKMMFIYQAQAAFEIWHGFKPEIDNEVIKLLNI